MNGFHWEGLAPGILLGLVFSVLVFVVVWALLGLSWQVFLRRVAELAHAVKGQSDQLNKFEGPRASSGCNDEHLEAASAGKIEPPAPEPPEQSHVLADQGTEKRTNLLRAGLGTLGVAAVVFISWVVVTSEPGAGCKAKIQPPETILFTPHEHEQVEESVVAPWRDTFFESETLSSQLPGFSPAPQGEQKGGKDNLGYPLEDRVIDFGKPEVAMRYFREAAERGVIEAQYNLGQGYWGGRGVEKNSLEAAKWFRKAAERGVVDAQYNLGVVYQTDAVLKDDQEAAKWFLKAAEAGDVGAQSELGFLFSLGQGLTQNDERAAFWWGRAAGQGDPAAQNGLGDLYSRAAGVSKDSIEALKWLNLAAAQNYKGASGKLAAFKSKVTPEEFLEAKRRADEFVPTNAKVGQTKQPEL